MSHDAPKDGYPLTWPVGVPRAKFRRSSDFKVVSLSRNLEYVAGELRRMGAKNVVISCTIPRRRDGFPLANASEPTDPGVAVYFDRTINNNARSFVIANDCYTRVAENMRAVAATIEALRAIERYGSSTMLEQAYAGFAQLPPAPASSPTSRQWWEVLGVGESATRAEIQKAYFELARRHHPDVGGNEASMAMINAARDVGLKAAHA